MAWALERDGLAGDEALAALLAMLLEDTVHAGLAAAPLVNAALGATIRGAGLTRARGGMHGFFRRLTARYRELGGRLVLGARVERVVRVERGDAGGLAAASRGGFAAVTARRTYTARQVVSTLPIWNAARVGPPGVAAALAPFLARDADALGGAALRFLGVPEDEVAGQAFTHHQILLDYRQPLGDGNNMFVSVSAAGDLESAPAGCRAVMLSTHTELAAWEGLGDAGYAARKAAVGERLLAGARRVYPDLGRAARVDEMATPRTFERFTSRPAAPSAACASIPAMPTSTPCRTTSAWPVTGRPATPPGRASVPSPASSAAATSPTASCGRRVGTRPAGGGRRRSAAARRAR